MKIDSSAAYLYSSQRMQPSNGPRLAAAESSSFSSALAARTSESANVKQSDFTSMTRQEIFDWMNGQIRSGKMSLDESAPFLGMTMKISVATGQSVDMATDTTRVNYFEKARLGIEGALSRNDPELAQRLQGAIEIMYRQQGQTLGVDAHA